MSWMLLNGESEGRMASDVVDDHMQVDSNEAKAHPPPASHGCSVELPADRNEGRNAKGEGNLHMKVCKALSLILIC